MPTDVIYDVNYHGDDPPEEKLSKQIIRLFLSNKRNSHKCEPIKPPPPVIKILFI